MAARHSYQKLERQLQEVSVYPCNPEIHLIEKKCHVYDGRISAFGYSSLLPMIFFMVLLITYRL